jgi:Flp pilus assembly protein TadD
VLANRGDTGNAEILLREAIPDADPDIRWKANGILAEILLKRGDTQGAAVILKNALLTAPENMRQPITQMIIKLGGTP